ncbi:hypothetical protein P9281_27330 [Caballeronia sp. LP003]|uniref:hypothetical protein n=1 Tax=Caballeronia sp. LP003 TaxID=3038551 RepID=UPI002861CFAB|nr:hypothetical protein [Caballeronia sp. LP003]MDR5790262.1 hypothetical protein [Caballeronia sp. LP003]
MNSNINIRKSLDALIAAGFSVSFHTFRHPIFIQKRRIAEACQLAGIEPVLN